ncbi:NADH dehydrogenase ubiquinone Fe-S protein 4 [Rickettsiales endosymbiont of Trichoplax sp. H2]|uniref:NADH dehydrogenase ubiquinone Fe-S protein 4 n=1 Tax=Rickettsiales endosymbiont of Trichoplax sp. H2 TaxID=2021221 RepID=UPI0012B1D0EF|nr:NADH dehydrogenase ubiquinone Fe-S protein 4 [Rickettsiales endosymbiont of Trichoplax sp. H2]MSO14497.1 NADH-ubiquinone oxidoreductase 21 kDa subunit, mitochondrial [Rickettsiales endosymbiont of Trichoplax sp. H2]
MIVKIFKEYKNPTQSGKANTNHWTIEFLSNDDRFQEQIMGWTGSTNMYPSEVKLQFKNKEEAINFAKKNKLEFFVQDLNKQKFTIKSYVNNYLS